MARIQEVKQRRFLETEDAPLSSSQVQGGFSSGTKFKNLPSVAKASKLLHIARFKKFSTKGTKIPSIPKMPKF